MPATKDVFRGARGAPRGAAAWQDRNASPSESPSSLPPKGGRRSGKERVRSDDRSRNVVASLLAAAGLSRHEKTLVRNGWDSVQRIRMLTEDDLV
jgi:hypothetical protein